MPRPQPTIAHQLITIAAAAELRQVHPRTIRRWIADGRLTAYRVGPHLIRVDVDDLDAMLRPIPAAGAVAV
jgi:excisionase family DNA binding protein